MGTTWQPEYLPSTQEIRDAFAEEISALGGTVPDVYHDGLRFLARAVLPADAEVRPDDPVRAGVAVRATGTQIRVHPYTFRQVCSNGAIAAHAIGTHRLRRIEATEGIAPTYDVAVVLSSFRLAVRGYTTPDVFNTVTNELRAAANVEADIVLHLLPALAQMSERRRAEFLPDILERFDHTEDRSVFGLLNAVTSLARDTDAPESRWDLEVLGGRIPAYIDLRSGTGHPRLAVVGN